MHPSTSDRGASTASELRRHAQRRRARGLEKYGGLGITVHSQVLNSSECSVAKAMDCEDGPAPALAMADAKTWGAMCLTCASLKEPLC